MAKKTIPCRVCGKMFVPCNKPIELLGAFNYRAFACSPECGITYIKRVEAAREKELENINSNMVSSLDEVKIETIEQISEVSNEVTKDNSGTENVPESYTTVAYAPKKNKRREG